MYRATQQLFTLIFWLLGHTWFRLEVRGQEHLRGLRGPVILAANHKSYIDHFVIFAALPGRWRSLLLPVRAMAADVYFHRWPFGWILKALGTYPSFQGQGMEVSLAKPLEILRQGGVVGIYPEGKRVFEPGISLFRRGVGELARRAPGVPILPIATVGTRDAILQILPRPFRRVRVAFGKPYVPDPTQSAETIAALLRERIEFLYRPMIEPVVEPRTAALPRPTSESRMH